MATAFKPYTIPVPVGFQDYPGYFRDTVREVALPVISQGIVTLCDCADHRLPRIILQSEDEKVLQRLARAIDDEIRTTPFSFGLAISLADLESEGALVEIGVRPPLEKLTLNRDYKIITATFEEGEEDYALVSFNRASHLRLMASVVPVCHVVNELPQTPAPRRPSSPSSGAQVVTYGEFRTLRTKFQRRHHDLA